MSIDSSSLPRPAAATARRAAARRAAWLLVTLTLCLSACGGGGGGETPAPQPVQSPAPAPAPAPTPAPPASIPTAVGEPIGARVGARIGPAGGALASADGALVVEIPAGAFDREHEVAIEEIENHAHGRVGRAWRITPEGLSTPQPMTLRFRYSPAELRGTTTALLGIATQAADGTWRVYRKPEHDAGSATLSIRTRHFSDWSKVAGAQLLPGETAVEVGREVELRVVRCEYVENEDSDDFHVPMPDELRKCDSEPLWNWTLRDWAVNGTVGGTAANGTVQPVGDVRSGEAIYRAPASAPARNPVAVSVTLPELWGVGEQTLVSNITVNDGGAACSHLRHRPVWNGTWGIRYSFAGANEEGDTLRSTLRADVTARLVVLAEGPNGVTWQGPATGTFEFDQEHVDSGPVPDVTTAAGGGAPYVDARVADGSHVTLSIDFRNCQYTTSFALYGRVLLARRGEVEELPRVGLGAAHAVAPRAMPSSGTLQGGGAFTAHSVLWGLMNPGSDVFLPHAADPFSSGFAAEGEAGAAAVEWSFAPEGG